MSPLKPSNYTIEHPKKFNIDEPQTKGFKIPIMSLVYDLKDYMNKAINEIYPNMNKHWNATKTTVQDTKV